MSREAVVSIIALCAAAGCSETSPADDGVTPPAVTCEVFEMAVPGEGCVAVGVPVDGCAAGWSHDGEFGCEPALPAEACPPGMMALPSETSCHPIMACGGGRWGDIVIEAGTQHVDASYIGVSDGTAAQPWTTITEAVAAAASGGLIAVAAGSYAENIFLQGKAVRIRGVCPEQVEIVGSGSAPAVLIEDLADGSEVGGVAIRGSSYGVLVAGSLDVAFDHLWVHDTAARGVDMTGANGPTSVTLSDSLIERAADIGLRTAGVMASFTRNVVRHTQPLPDATGGTGVSLEVPCFNNSCDWFAASNVAVDQMVVQHNAKTGIFVMASTASIEDTVVRHTNAQASDGRFGNGIAVELACAGVVCEPTARAYASIKRVLVEGSMTSGIHTSGADAEIEATVIRGGKTNDAIAGGSGLNVELACFEEQCYPEASSNVTLRTSLVEDNELAGILASGSGVTVEASVVRGTLPHPGELRFGRGISIQPVCLVTGCDGSLSSWMTLQHTLVDNNFEGGVVVFDSAAAMAFSVIRNTKPRAADALFGDGLMVLGTVDTVTNVTLDHIQIEDSSRAGIANFGGSVALFETAIRCADIPLNASATGAMAAVFDDIGGNRCGCPDVDGVCKVTASTLQPPAPLQ